ncbi:NAD synthetase [Pseudomonas sp. NPDC088444]|uniref:NAD synthetase n=1 Tax=Pseudomonas sp. NPDC088444 TaxID=3364456 RepID=UPI00384C430F
MSINIRDGFSVARSMARDRFESSIDLRALFRAIDADPAIAGAGVIFIDSDSNVVVVREFQPICSISVKRVFLQEVPRHMAPQEFARDLELRPRKSKLVDEAINAAIACTGAYISWTVFYAGGLAAPMTLGGSIVISGIALSSAVAGTGQCLIGAGKVAGEMFFPDKLDELTSQTWFEDMNQTLDRITLVGASTSLFVTARFVLAARAATGKSIRSVLKGLSPRERLNLTIELHQYRMQTVGLSGRITNAEIRKQATIQRNDLSAAFLAIGGSINSGVLRPYVIGIFEE